ncbi:MAG: hypothetical protein ACI91Q_001003, partial [Gammaproteobacteria bacterium]
PLSPPGGRCSPQGFSPVAQTVGELTQSHHAVQEPNSGSLFDSSEILSMPLKKS